MSILDKIIFHLGLYFVLTNDFLGTVRSQRK